ncbi:MULTISPECIES: hypothetical protein [unclassified Mesorhizobium]|uniref:hypothetical protein n=1 Tax=unclassified Mesorhizobium TaxID=325217 RepID=UPI001CCB10C7|nr:MULTISPECIES: hypothetical protein [unclassified Mesorhizobium]MBZ9683860.1 hypothetical protein [Mesorhizobium sp. CO1-1-2]MBZ9923652.1 hypothetical protein [Mesorhizobium sp. BR1-1-4]
MFDVHSAPWLATPGMGSEKISAFYDDPIKIAADEKAMRSSLYAKAIATETALEWRIRRLRNNTARKLMIIGRKRTVLDSGGQGPVLAR